MTLQFEIPRKLRITKEAKKTDKWYSKHCGKWFDIIWEGEEENIQWGTLPRADEYKVRTPEGYLNFVSRKHCKTDSEFACDRLWKETKEMEEKHGITIMY